MDGMSPIDWSYSPSYASGFNERNVPEETIRSLRYCRLLIYYVQVIGILDVKSPFIYDAANSNI